MNYFIHLEFIWPQTLINLYAGDSVEVRLLLLISIYGSENGIVFVIEFLDLCCLNIDLIYSFLNFHELLI